MLNLGVAPLCHELCHGEKSSLSIKVLFLILCLKNASNKKHAGAYQTKAVGASIRRSTFWLLHELGPLGDFQSYFGPELWLRFEPRL